MNDCEYLFYAVTKTNKLVMGFDDQNECNKYCNDNQFKRFTRNGLKNKKINPHKLENWVYDNEVPEFK